MIENRSIPRCTVIPQLPYRDVKQATAWLCDVFGFSLRIDIGSHRAQLGDGAVVLTELDGGAGSQEPRTPGRNASVMVRVSDVYQHHEQARQHGAGCPATGGLSLWRAAILGGRSRRLHLDVYAIDCRR